MGGFLGEKENEVTFRDEAMKAFRVFTAGEQHPVRRLFREEVLTLLRSRKWKIESTQYQFVAYVERHEANPEVLLDFVNEVAQIFDRLQEMHARAEQIPTASPQLV